MGERVTKELTEAERHATLVNVYKFQYFAIFRHIGERFGWEVANDIADEMAAESIPVIAEGYKRKFVLPGEGAALVSQVLATEFQAEGSDFVSIEETEERAEYAVDCSFGRALQSGKFDDVDITDGLCHRSCWAWTDKVAKTVDERLSVERTHWMGTPPPGRESGSRHDGCERCRFTIAPSSPE